MTLVSTTQRFNNITTKETIKIIAFILNFKNSIIIKINVIILIKWMYLYVPIIVTKYHYKFKDTICDEL